MREDADLRDEIQKLALQRRHEGYRRITQRLRTLGLFVNAKRVLRLMRADNLLSLRKKPFVPRTTDSRHPFPIAANLIRGLDADRDQSSLGRRHHLCPARRGASSISPSCSTPTRARWWAGRSKTHLDARLPLSRARHGDRRARPAARPHPPLRPRRAIRLRANMRRGWPARQIQRSMSRPGNPYDNAKAESFMKTLKTEEVDGRAYADLEEARASIGQFIEDVYNADRLHSALGYKSPIDFENAMRMTASLHEHATTALSPN